MLSSLLRRLRQISRRIYVRVVLFALLALLAQVTALVVGPYIPQRMAGIVGAGAVDDILQIIATSMLAVTTFSLTIMLSAMNNAAGQWTPRSHLILREDTITHSVLANFLGAYLFALVGIVLRAAGLFDERGIVVLFGMTLVVVAVLVVSLIRWIIHLEGLGSLTHTADRLTAQAEEALSRAWRWPCHGGHALTDPGAQIPKAAVAFHAQRAGYLTQVFEDAIEAEAAQHKADVYLVVSVGQYVLEGEVLGYVDGRGGKVGKAMVLVLQESLPLDSARSFDQDPLFGLTVLAEIGTRALSPGVNDPGTAIDIINRLGRLVTQAGTREPQRDQPRCKHLWVPPLPARALFEVSFEPIARCAGDALEVHQALQSSLNQVATFSKDQDVVAAARTVARQCLERAEAQLDHPADFDRLQASAPAG